MSNLNELINNGMLKYADKKGMSIKKLPFANADKIRSMSDEELAEFICGIIDLGKDKFINGIIIPNYDKDSIKKYLQSEVSE